LRSAQGMMPRGGLRSGSEDRHRKANAGANDISYLKLITYIYRNLGAHRELVYCI